MSLKKDWQEYSIDTNGEIKIYIYTVDKTLNVNY